MNESVHIMCVCVRVCVCVKTQLEITYRFRSSYNNFISPACYNNYKLILLSQSHGRKQAISKDNL